MKVAVTGHKQGLGRAIYNHFLTQGHEMIGFSKRQGIELIRDFDRICDVASECDVFFNNAHDKNVQARFIQALVGKVAIVTSGAMGAYTPSRDTFCFEKKQVEMAHLMQTKPAKPMLLLRMHTLENKDPNGIPFTTILNAIDFWLKNPRVSLIEFPN